MASVEIAHQCHFCTTFFYSVLSAPSSWSLLLSLSSLPVSLSSAAGTVTLVLLGSPRLLLAIVVTVIVYVFLGVEVGSVSCRERADSERRVWIGSGAGRVVR